MSDPAADVPTALDQGHSPPLHDFRRFAVARALLLDRLTAEIVGRLEDAGVACILLKGPAVAAWLYPGDDVRPYGDADLLVAPDDEPAARALMERLGFHSEFAEVDHPRIGAESWIRRPHEVVDLHTTLWGMNAGARRVWRVFSTDTEDLEVGGRALRVPDLRRRALVLALHAAQHGDAERPIQDLDRAVRALGPAEWAGVLELARELEAEPAVATGLRQSAEGRHLADELGLPRAGSVEAELRVGGVPLAEGIEQVLSERGLRAKARLLRRELVPTPEFMRWWSPLASRGRIGLAAAYAWRLGWIARRTPAAAREWRRVRRRAARA